MDERIFFFELSCRKRTIVVQRMKESSSSSCLAEEETSWYSGWKNRASNDRIMEIGAPEPQPLINLRNLLFMLNDGGEKNHNRTEKVARLAI